MNISIYAVEALVSIAAGAFAALGFLHSRQKALIADVVGKVTEPLVTRVTVLETKLDVFWASVATDAARILHHPEATRERVDALLDAFLSRTLSADQAGELRGYLEVIRDWEPGAEAPFRVFAGEQVAAAILLHTMGHVAEEAR